jgi:hypothetical protein
MISSRDNWCILEFFLTTNAHFPTFYFSEKCTFPRLATPVLSYERMHWNKWSCVLKFEGSSHLDLKNQGGAPVVTGPPR